MVLSKCCTQYVSKFGNLSSGYRTGRGQFSFQSQRKVMPNNFQTTIQLHSFHMLARECSNPFRSGFNSTWPENFQMYKLGLEKVEDLDIKLPTFVGQQIKQRNSINSSISASLTMLKPLTMWITTNCGIFSKKWEYQAMLPVSWETCMKAKKQQLEPDMKQWTG